MSNDALVGIVLLVVVVLAAVGGYMWYQNESDKTNIEVSL